MKMGEPFDEIMSYLKLISGQLERLIKAVEDVGEEVYLRSRDADKCHKRSVKDYLKDI
jgi:hypothetical protein